MKQPMMQIFGVGEIDDLTEEFFREAVEKDHQKTALIKCDEGGYVHSEISDYEMSLNAKELPGVEDVFESLIKLEGIAALKHVTRPHHWSGPVESAKSAKRRHGAPLDHPLELCTDESPLEWSKLKATTVELKPLPEGLRYAFLGSKDTYPVIVNNKLNPDELELLLSELQKFRKVIGYSLEDIRGISPSLCTHRIHLENEIQSSVEH